VRGLLIDVNVYGNGFMLLRVGFIVGFLDFSWHQGFEIV